MPTVGFGECGPAIRGSPAVVDGAMSGNEWLPLNIGAPGKPVSSLGRLAQQLPSAVDASGLAVGVPDFCE